VALNHNILLESGTNEFEIIEFVINSDVPYYFCINVAKVIEVINYPHVRYLPELNASILGTSSIRKKIVPIIDLAHWLGIKSTTDHSKSKVIITFFNGITNGFVVSEVVRIHRIAWSDIKDYSSMSDLKLVDAVLGVVNIKSKLVQLLDFERIVIDLDDSKMMDVKNIDLSLSHLREKKLIYLAEDSAVIRKALENVLKKAGYQIKIFDNGRGLLESFDNAVPDIIVTDLEMPGTSGDFVVRTIRKNKIYDSIPIIVFSSMASVENERKLKSIGANLLLGKPHLDLLLQKIDEFTLNIKEEDF